MFGVMAVMLMGCRGPVNPSFDLSLREAADELDVMAENPVKLRRPVVVLAGWQDPNVGAPRVARMLREATGDERIISVAFFFDLTFERCRRKVLDAVREAFGDVEVDVVGVSMGGIVARYAALDEHDTPLRIARLFTISTPHRGARIAAVPFPDPRAGDMKRGSTLMEKLDAADRGYTIVPYVRLHDFMVGAHNASPPGDEVWWVNRPLLEPAHLFSYRDKRIIADIARQLRGEARYADPPPAALPR